MSSVNHSPAPGSGSSASSKILGPRRGSYQVEEVDSSDRVMRRIWTHPTCDYAGGHQLGHQIECPGYHHQYRSSRLLIWPTPSVGPSFNHSAQSQFQLYPVSYDKVPARYWAHHVCSVPPAEPTVLCGLSRDILGESAGTSSKLLSESPYIGDVGGIRGESPARASASSPELSLPESLDIGDVSSVGSTGKFAINTAGGRLCGHMNLEAGTGSSSRSLEHGTAAPILGAVSPQHGASVFPNGAFGGYMSTSLPVRCLSKARGWRNRTGQRSAARTLNVNMQYRIDLDRIMCGEDSRTTVMITRIPINCTSEMLLAAIEKHHRGTFDFFYLPREGFDNEINPGIAFINMKNASHIVPFYRAFNGKRWERSGGLISLSYARIQGSAALVAEFRHLFRCRNKRRVHRSIDRSYCDPPASLQ